jgi:chromosome partitioning protein
MRAVAVYNMKGGVGKTTTAVNLSYVAAAAGHRALLWDLDPQAASSFAFRVRPRVAGFGKKSLESGQGLSDAIKETDYPNLDLLPADFGYRKFDRLLGELGKPERVITALLDTLGCGYDVVFLDCPAGFSLLTEGVLRAADAVLVPTIPTVLSLRTVARLIKWADRSGLPSKLSAFFSMVDRRKTLHRRACEWSATYPEVFLVGQIPYASVVEQMAVRRMPLAVFAARDPATTAFTEIWAELQTRLQQRGEASTWQRDRWVHMLQAIESLIERLESADGQKPGAGAQLSGAAEGGAGTRSALEELVHSFDTERRDLQRSGHVLELRERRGILFVVAAPSGKTDGAHTTRGAQVQIDSSWALQILAGEMSPLEAFERRLGRPGPCPVENLRAIIGGRSLRRIDSHVPGHGY